MFLPEEASFYFGGTRMTLCRLLLLLIAPVVFLRMWQLMASNNYRFVWSDVFVPVTGLWMFVGPIEVDGFDRAFAYGHLEKYSLEAGRWRLRSPRCRFNGREPFIEAI
jgi:hypothetical protein